MSGNWSCANCGSRNLTWEVGDCDGCGKSMNGEAQPVSRSEGFFHRTCWLARQTSAVTAGDFGGSPLSVAKDVSAPSASATSAPSERGE